MKPVVFTRGHLGRAARYAEQQERAKACGVCGRRAEDDCSAVECGNRRSLTANYEPGRAREELGDGGYRTRPTNREE